MTTATCNRPAQSTESSRWALEDWSTIDPTDYNLLALAPAKLEPHDDDGLAQVLGSSVTYLIAVGPRMGHKASTLQTLSAQHENARTSDCLANAAGFFLRVRHDRSWPGAVMPTCAGRIADHVCFRVLSSHSLNGLL